MMLRSDDIPRLSGALILDAGGQPVGTVQQVYQNPTTGNPVWVSVTANPGAPRVFISLVRATWNPTAANTLEVVFTSSTIAGSPLIEATEQLSSADITTLASYYQASFATANEPDVEDDHGFTAEPVVVTRSEEQAQIRTLSVPVERVRFHKVIVTEEKQITVTIRREELRIDRSPIDTTHPGESTAPSAASPDLDIVLHEERVVVRTETVPVERVRVGITRVTGETTVDVALNKERVEVTQIPARP